MANAIDLTTLAKVKRWLGLASNNLDDQILEDLITSCSDLIREFLGRDIVKLTYTNDVYDGTGADSIVLRQYPIISLTSVSVGGSLIADAVAAGRMLRRTSGIFPPGAGNVLVTYEAGYDPIPHGLDQACVEMVGEVYKSKDRIGHVSKQLGGDIVTFDMTDIPARIKTSLHQWMSVVPV